MKKRRTLILSLLLVSALALGLGYAGFTSDLSLTGEAILGGVSESQVVIKTVEIEDGNSSGAHIVASATGEGTKAATVDVTGFERVNEYALVTVVVENPHEFDVNLTVKDLVIANNIISGTDEYFTIEYEGSLPTSIAATSTASFQIRITANVITPDAHTSNFTVGITASTRTP